jgi:hypothetical protein
MARKKVTGDDLSARGKENGYQRGLHRDKDNLREQNKHVDKVKKDQNAALDPVWRPWPINLTFGTAAAS